MAMCASSLKTLPQPFGWKAVPAGKVKVISLQSKEGREKNYIPSGTSQVFDVNPFKIAKYPVTNAQFAKFIEAQGYSQHQWWTDAGWQEKEENHWVEPYYWKESRWNKEDYPVIGVSWYESIAFCRWLSYTTKEQISLPTEQQWQYAAQGDTDRAVAWGDVDDEIIRCNWDTEGTTSVMQYEGKGDSPFGVVDMTGNVWEWCLTKYYTGESNLNGTDIRILRGGGWAMIYSHEINIRTTDRMPLRPSTRLNYVGFRLIS